MIYGVGSVLGIDDVPRQSLKSEDIATENLLEVWGNPIKSQSKPYIDSNNDGDSREHTKALGFVGVRLQRKLQGTYRCFYFGFFGNTEAFFLSHFLYYSVSDSGVIQVQEPKKLILISVATTLACFIPYFIYLHQNLRVKFT